MSLVRPAWLYAACMTAFTGGVLWFFLRPDAEAAEPAAAIASVESGLVTAMPIDLAVSSGLFSASGAPAEAAALDATAQPASSATPPRLVGIAIKARGASVALAVDAAGATHLIRPGESVDGWTLDSLSRAGAQFSRDGQGIAVQLGEIPTAPSPTGPTQTAVAPASTSVTNTQAGSTP